MALGRREKEQKERNKEQQERNEGWEKEGGEKVVVYVVHTRSIDMSM